MKELVLLSLQEPRDLYQACSVSKENLEICSGESFWTTKFRREGLPVLETGNDFTHWLRIYTSSIEAAQKADQLLDKEIIIDMSLVNKPDLLQLFKSDTKIKDFWSYANSQKTETKYYVTISQNQESGLYVYFFQHDFSQPMMNHRRTLPLDLRFGGILSQRDVWVLLYRLAYFAYPF